jgi:hypothetical protein
VLKLGDGSIASVGQRGHAAEHAQQADQKSSENWDRSHRFINPERVILPQMVGKQHGGYPLCAMHLSINS